MGTNIWPSKQFSIALITYHAREPLYSNSAVIAWWLQSTSAQNSVPRVFFGQYFTAENIHRELLSLINPTFCGLSFSRFSATDIYFFPEKRMKEAFAYVLEFMPTLAKMKNDSTLM